MDHMSPRKASDLVLAFHLRSRDVAYNLHRAAKAFELIHDLGGNGVRFDLSWYDLQPERGQLDREKIEWYREFIRQADAHGLELIIILVGAPPWASRLLQYDRRAFLEHWKEY